jgi:hypothetical protein
MPTPLSTVPNTLSKTTKRCSRWSHSTPPNIADVPTDLSTPFDYLTKSDTDAGPVQRPLAGMDHGTASPTSGCTCTRRLCTARMYGHTHVWDVRNWRGSKGLKWHNAFITVRTAPGRQIMEKSIITLHASWPWIIPITFKCNTIIFDCPRRP